MKCPRCHDPDLTSPLEGGGPLSSSTCARCGGGLLPEDGLTRLLEEMKHTREEMRELAALYAGARVPCPACRSKMSPLVLRGASLDMCFGCGSLWVDRGELEVISGGRYALPAPTAPAPAPAIAPAQALVRVDERSLPRHMGRAFLAGIGSVGVIWGLAGIVPFASALAGAAALAAAAGLSRREAFDVLPRARRMMRWRGWFAPDARSELGETFSPDACVVVRRLRVPLPDGPRELPFVVVDLVDAEGRDLARLKGPMLPPTAWTEGPRYARALGVSVRFDVEPMSDDALDAREGKRTDLPPLLTANVLSVSTRQPPPGAKLRHLPLLDAEGAPLGLLTTEVPARRDPQSLDELFGEHFLVHDREGAPRLRLFSTELFGERATILVGADGKVLGHVRVRRGPLADTFTFAGPQARRGATLSLRHGDHHARLFDVHGRAIGALETANTSARDPRPATLLLAEGHLTGEARFGLWALAIHVSLVPCVERL